MSSCLSIKKLNYNLDDQVFFENFNLEIEKQQIVSIIAPNKSGKSMLTKLLCAVLPTDNFFILDGIFLNKKNVLKYITKIGIVTNDIEKPFIFKKVKDELAYPLKNLGYLEHSINKKIMKISSFFEIDELLNKNISSLNNSAKSKLLIIIALLHEPKLIVLDDAFLEMNSSDKSFMLKKLQELNDEGLTILNITSNLDTIYFSHKVYVMNQFKIEKEGTVEEILEMDSYLNEIGLNIPFIIDLSSKLKFYNLIDKLYYDVQSLGDSLWK